MDESNVKFTGALKDTVSGRRASRAFTGSLILGSASPDLSGLRPGSTPSSRKHSVSSGSDGSNDSSRTGTPPSPVPRSSLSSGAAPEIERCACCTIDDFWKIYDSFCLMDKRACGSVRRGDFFEATTEHVTLDMRRTITRGDLHQRFRESAGEMTLEELLGRVFPTSSEADRKMMDNWAKLRDASKILADPQFMGTRHDLKKIFDLLDVDGSKSLSMSELTRARILSKGEAQKLLKNWYQAFNDKQTASSDTRRDSLTSGLSFNEFCLLTQKHLVDKYANKEETATWESHWRSAFHSSQATTAMVKASRDGFDLSPEKTPVVPLEPSPTKSLKSAANGVKNANSAFGRRGSQFQNQVSAVLAC